MVARGINEVILDYGHKGFNCEECWMRGVGIGIEGLKLGGKFILYRCDCGI